MTAKDVYQEDCVFCGIGQGDISVDVLFEDDTTLFFPDRSPRAPVHILGIPKKHIASLADINEQTQDMIGHLLRTLTIVAREAGVENSGYRVVTNSGPDSGQIVPHLHFHLLGGEPLGPLVC